MIRAVVALAMLAGAMVLAGGRVEAFVGDHCARRSDCGSHEFCLADSLASSTGHCAAGKVLP